MKNMKGKILITLLTLLIIFSNKNVYGQLSEQITLNRTCNEGNFYDSGGPNGNYSNNENITTIISPETEGQRVRVNFNNFNISFGDSLFVYNGPNESFPLISTLINIQNNSLENFISTHESGALTFVFTSDNISFRPGWDASVVCEAKPCIVAPTDFITTNINKTSVDLSWSQIGEPSGWTLEYGTAGFTLGSGTEISAETNTISLADLESGTSYDIYIKANCENGEFSDIIDPLNFTTLPDFCAGDRFYDSGGPNGNYTNNENITTIISPETEGQRVRVSFNNFNISFGDSLFVYNGPNESFPLINTLTNIPTEDIVSSHESGALTFVFTSDGSFVSNGWDASVVCEAKPCIVAPTDFITTNINKTSVDLSWSQIGEPSGWTLEYGTTGFTLGSGTEISAETNTISLNDLESGTSYDIYIKTNCENGGFSDIVGPLNFTTLPDFCAGDRFYDSGGPNGDYADIENITTFIAPDTNEERVRVIFNSFSLESCCDRLFVYDGPDTSAPLINTLTNIPTEDIVSSHESGALTFVFTSDGSVTRSGWDATVICEAKPCVAPVDFIVSDINSTEVNLSWNQEGEPSGWTLEYGTAGFTLGSGTEIFANTNTIGLDDLEPGTAYDIYIKANCENGGFSEIIGPLNFSTACNFLSDSNNLIQNGSFECLSEAPWIISGDLGNSSCSQNFSIGENSEDTCRFVNEVSPSNGNKAAFTSFDSDTDNTKYILEQNILIPDNINSFNTATLSFDFKVNYIDGFGLPPTKDKVLKVSIKDMQGNELFIIEEIKFGLNPQIGSIDITHVEDIITNLNLYAGQTAVFSLEAIIPEASIGFSKAMIDNISLILDDSVLSDNENIIIENELAIYPIPNNGNFTIENKNGNKISYFEIFDTSGRVLLKKTITNPINKINISIPQISGIYFIKITDSNKQIKIKKFFIK